MAMFCTQSQANVPKEGGRKNLAQRYPMWRREVKIIHTKEGKRTGNMRSCLVNESSTKLHNSALVLMRSLGCHLLGTNSNPRSREGGQQTTKNTYVLNGL